MIALALMIAASAASSADIRPLLRDQGFVGPINGRETIKFVGQIGLSGDGYQIYTYHGVHRAAAVDHGVNRVIVIRNGRNLVGSYAASLPVTCRVHQQRVVCNAGIIDFASHGPPSEVQFDGERQKLEIGNRLKK